MWNMASLVWNSTFNLLIKSLCKQEVAENDAVICNDVVHSLIQPEKQTWIVHKEKTWISKLKGEREGKWE